MNTNPSAGAAIAAVDPAGDTPLQQWELLASPGHVLLEQVSALWRLAKRIGWLMGAAAFIGLLAFWLPNIAGSALGTAAAKVSSLFERKVELPPVSQAPLVGAITPRVPYQLQQTTVDGLLSATEFVAAMKDAAGKLQAGQPMDCERSMKVTDEWLTDANNVPRCRESADKTRLWVWAGVKEGGRFAPVMGVLRKADGKVTFSRVDVPNTIALQGVESINPQLVPRAIAADFAELAQGGAR